MYQKRVTRIPRSVERIIASRLSVPPGRIRLAMGPVGWVAFFEAQYREV